MLLVTEHRLPRQQARTGEVTRARQAAACASSGELLRRTRVDQREPRPVQPIGEPVGIHQQRLARCRRVTCRSRYEHPRRHRAILTLPLPQAAIEECHTVVPQIVQREQQSRGHGRVAGVDHHATRVRDARLFQRLAQRIDRRKLGAHRTVRPYERPVPDPPRPRNLLAGIGRVMHDMDQDQVAVSRVRGKPVGRDDEGVVGAGCRVRLRPRLRGKPRRCGENERGECKGKAHGAAIRKLGH